MSGARAFPSGPCVTKSLALDVVCLLKGHGMYPSQVSDFQVTQWTEDVRGAQADRQLEL